MKILVVRELRGEVVINLDAVTLIEFDETNSPSLDFWLGDRVVRFTLRAGTESWNAWDRLHQSLMPLYEGRMNNIMGMKMVLDLTPLQNDKVAF